MKSSRSKSTKRFNFNVKRNTTSHHAGANTVTITPKSYDSENGKYTTPSGDSTVTMTVQEAKALQNFLNSQFSD